MPPTTSCCRSCPRCRDCPVLVAARARALRREEQAATVEALVGDVFAGAMSMARRPLPETVERTLEALDAARRRKPVAA